MSIFPLRIYLFRCVWTYRWKLQFKPCFVILLNSIDFLKVVLINMIVVLLMPTILAIPGFLNIKMFSNKCYDVKIFVHGVTNKRFITWFELYCLCGHMTKVCQLSDFYDWRHLNSDLKRPEKLSFWRVILVKKCNKWLKLTKF